MSMPVDPDKNTVVLPSQPPIDYTVNPTDLSRTDNLMGAENDSDALMLFLNKSGARSPETLRRYERETLRFTAYLYGEIHIGYQAVRLKHLQQYLLFIQNLPARWLEPGVIHKQPERILFKGSIKPGKSTDQVIDVLSSFFSFLDKNRYTIGNPATSLVRTGEKKARGVRVVRYFFDEEWRYVLECLDAMATGSRKNESYRARYMLSLSYGLALRESELTEHSCADIHPDGDKGYYLNVLGKGKKLRQLPVNSHLQQQIRHFREYHGLTGIYGDPMPLAPKSKRKNRELVSMSSRGLRYWWQSFMQYCASRTSDEHLAARLTSIPFHALRHTALTHLARKMDIEDLAIFAGHDSINTTSQYYHAEAHRLKKLTDAHHI